MTERSIFYQSWPIVGGTLTVRVDTDRPLTASEVVEVGKVMGEAERLAGLLRGSGPAGELQRQGDP